MLSRKLYLCDPAAVVFTQVRKIKTLDVRDYKCTGDPMEVKFYQRYTVNPARQGGIIFNNHFETHRRWDVKGEQGLIDWVWWEKENGQAQVPHRHQRTIFDFHDQLHPTKSLPGVRDGGASNFKNQDPSDDRHPELSSNFNPNSVPFNEPYSLNKAFTDRNPHSGSWNKYFKPTNSFHMEHSTNMQWGAGRMSDTNSNDLFGNDYMNKEYNPNSNAQNVSHLSPMHNVSNVPGLDRPYLGEKDRKMMQAMTRTYNESENTSVTYTQGRFSSHVFLNRPQVGNTLDGKVLSELPRIIDRETTGLHKKMITVTAAQSGLTDFFCGGLDLEDAAETVALMQQALADSKLLLEKANKKKVSASKKKELQKQANICLQRAADYQTIVDNNNRNSMAVLWRMFSAPRSLHTIINGRCKNIGNGIALMCKYPGLRDSTEFVHDGPNMGITPFGGLTHFLSRTETSLKYPGLAEFVMMTGSPLYAGDALKLGWSDLFSTIPDVNYYTKEWFDDSEHMANDAVAWQTEHLFNSMWKMKEHHSTQLERSSMSPTRAKWVEEAFADQPSVESILTTLTEIEKMKLTDKNNNYDGNSSAMFSLPSAEAGVRILEQKYLKFSTNPWEAGDFADEGVDAKEKKQAGEFFTQYFLERLGGRTVAKSRVAKQAREWKEKRFEEYEAFKLKQYQPHPRHVYAKLEGCENKLIEFDFDFDREACARALNLSRGSEAAETAMLDVLKKKILAQLNMPLDRDIEVGWCLPTFSSAPLYEDGDVFLALHNDPSIQSPKNFTDLPPLYLTVRRSNLHFSEWAYAVKHQMLLASPFALKASLQMLNEIRGDGSEGSVQSTSEALATEFRYLSRMMYRNDFFQIGANSTKSSGEFQELDHRMRHNVHDENSARPIATFDTVFEKDVEVDGHKFLARPAWYPRTVQEVDDVEVANYATPLDFQKDGMTEIVVPTYTAKADRLPETINDMVGGMEVVVGLGERNDKGAPVVAPTESNAVVPNNVNFYQMARHPWMETETSWRVDGFTEGSQEYFTKQYEKAEQAIHDPENKGAHMYWPSKEQLTGQTKDAATEDETLLRDRFWNVISSANRNVENWARDLRANSEAGKLGYTREIINSEEKIYDDNFYRWHIRPGTHPNPSGILKGGKTAPKGSSSSAAAGEEAAAGGEGEDEITDFIRGPE